MIKYIQIENFKSLKRISIPMNKLNMFFGMNGMGKSSLLQALLLLRQSYWNNDKQNINKLCINGQIIKLGAGIDILSQDAEDAFIRFLVKYEDERKYDVKYDANTLDNGYLPAKEIVDGDYSDTLFNESFRYLSAEHIGPIDRYSITSWDRESPNYFGNKGEYVIPYLALDENRFVVADKLCHSKENKKKIMHQLSAWMSEISPGIRIITEPNQTEGEAKLSFAYDGEILVSTPYRPINVGFGIPYVLPLVAELLMSDESSLILIENPESHLHPKGQSALAKLIALAASNGAQIICESHSDHIINGIRLAVKNQIIGCEDVEIAYFDKDKNNNSIVNNIAVDSKGNLSEYPEGLLDEWGNLMAQLI